MPRPQISTHATRQAASPLPAADAPCGVAGERKLALRDDPAPAAEDFT
jgi:hypothetical protein